MKSLDGSGAVTPIAPGNAADWSHDGTKFAFTRVDGDGIPRIWTMNVDGTAQQQVPGVSGSRPAWSPDDDHLVFRTIGASSDIYRINPDGTGSTPLVTNPVFDLDPDWELTTPSYARPKGATPTRVSLSVPYEQCMAPDRTHGRRWRSARAPRRR